MFRRGGKGKSFARSCGGIATFAAGVIAALFLPRIFLVGILAFFIIYCCYAR